MANKKINKKFVLSDSSVNCYGFRLLTSGYQLSQFAVNPIGYYMHKREDGVILRWENLQIEGDKITGYPVVNLSNKRGEQTVAEVENGFLSAASMGNIVVLEYTDAPEMKVAGQTGATITKWYNKECSLVDVPGNSNALALMMDKGNNPILLANLQAAAPRRSTGYVAPAANEYPPELWWSWDKLWGEREIENIKKRDYTIFCALLWWWYDVEEIKILSRKDVNPDRFKAYIKEMTARRVAELVAMGYQKLFDENLLEELRELDSDAYAKFIQEHTLKDFNYYKGK